MLRYAVEQPAFDTAPFTTVDDTDEVVAHLRTLGMSHSAPAASAPIPALFPCLLKQIGGTTVDATLAITAHAFLDVSGLLQAPSTAHAARLEVLWCEHLRSLKFLDATRETLEWLPQTPAVVYIWARLWLDVGRDAEAAEALYNLMGSFGTLSLLIALPLALTNAYLTGPYSTLSFEDADALPLDQSSSPHIQVPRRLQHRCQTVQKAMAIQQRYMGPGHANPGEAGQGWVDSVGSSINSHQAQAL